MKFGFLVETFLGSFIGKLMVNLDFYWNFGIIGKFGFNWKIIGDLKLNWNLKKNGKC